jgi:DNA-binding NarL/FixJ family response regulator
MNSESIRVLVVDAGPGEGGALLARLEDQALTNEGVEGIEVVGVARNRRAAIQLAETTQPDVLLVDLMLPGYRSIDVVRTVTSADSEARILALVPADPPHDRIMLAVEAGALGYVCRDAASSEFAAAIQQIHQGEPWLPLHQTYEVLQDGAGELAISSEERRNRLSQVILGLIPLTGLVAAITAYLWRTYWGDVGVRVVDLGVDPTTRMIDVFVVLLFVVGVFGPLLFIRPWMVAIGDWIQARPSLASAVTRARSLRLGKLPVGRLLFNPWLAWVLLALLVVAVLLLLTRIMPLIMVLFVGPTVGVILLANLLDLDDELPDFLHLPHLEAGRVLGFLGLVLIVFLLALGSEVWIKGPDLRTDGLHGVLAPQVLGFRARPVLVYDLDGNLEPLGALYLGGNADLYVLYDPCAETVRFVPVGSSRVELVDQVSCRSP